MANTDYAGHKPPQGPLKGSPEDYDGRLVDPSIRTGKRMFSAHRHRIITAYFAPAATGTSKAGQAPKGEADSIDDKDMHMQAMMSMLSCRGHGRIRGRFMG